VTTSSSSVMSQGDCKSMLQKHKVKITWLNPVGQQKNERRKATGDNDAAVPKKPQLFPQPLRSFHELSPRYKVSKTLSSNVDDQGYTVPTEVQLAALPLLLEHPVQSTSAQDNASTAGPASFSSIDLLTVAPTGSGKTLAFMIPLLHNILRSRHTSSDSARSTAAIVLAPTKELVGQIVNEGRKLAKNTGIRVTQVHKGMHLSSSVEGSQHPSTNVKAGILVSTPGSLHNLLGDTKSFEVGALSSVRYLVLDEADVLLDPLFRDQTIGIWNALINPSLRVTLWSATMGSNVEDMARSTINTRLAQHALQTSEASEAPLIRLVVGLKDSAVPNVQHRLIYAATEQGKLMGLRQLIHPATSLAEAGPPLKPPFLVFTQTIERAVALHSELLYDIPAEAGGISRLAVLHSDLSDTARESIMTRFRKGEIWILVTTDLLSRGIDFRGINGVVNYDIPTSSAAYVHRVGRTGRAGREGGVAVTLYSKEDIPYLKHVANVVAMAQKQNGAQAASGAEGLQQWLLDSLPTLSKQDKQKLKKRGVEARTARGKQSDPKAARKARISTKSGYLRKTENNRKGAVLGSRRRSQQEVASEVGEESDFGGFD